MADGLFGMIIGFWVGFLVGAGFHDYDTQQQYKIIQSKALCEEHLPRDQHCKIVVTAVVDEESYED